MRIVVHTDEIVDWDSFHRVFARDMRFIEGYGENMNAWIDCMGDWSRPDRKGLMQHEIARGEDLVLVLKSGVAFAERLPEMALAIWDGTGVVNARFAGTQTKQRILLGIS